MYNVNINYYRENITSYYENEEYKIIDGLFKNIAFKLEKNLYYYGSIIDNVEKSSDTEDFLEMLPIYFDLETLFISLRSSVDVILHLINKILDLGLESRDVTVNTLYHSLDRNSSLRNIFNKYTRKRNNNTWNFLYYFRNDIVHEKSVYEIMSFEFMLVDGKNRLLISYREKEEDFNSLFKRCFSLIDGLLEEVLQFLLSRVKSHLS